MSAAQGMGVSKGKFSVHEYLHKYEPTPNFANYIEGKFVPVL
jgi:hypothetical protein